MGLILGVRTLNLRKITLKYMGWCPGVESAARFIPYEEVGRGKLIWVLMMLALYVGIFSWLPGVFRFLLILLSLVVVPYSWLRGEKAGDQEGSYPDPAEPHAFGEYGEFREDGPRAELLAFGPVRSSDGYRAAYLMQREWVHPDFYRLRKSWERRRQRAEEERKKGQTQSSPEKEAEDQEKQSSEL